MPDLIRYGIHRGATLELVLASIVMDTGLILRHAGLRAGIHRGAGPTECRPLHPCRRSPARRADKLSARLFQYCLQPVQNQWNQLLIRSVAIDFCAILEE